MSRQESTHRTSRQRDNSVKRKGEVMSQMQRKLAGQYVDEVRSHMHCKLEL